VQAQHSKGLFGNRAVAVATVLGLPVAVLSLAVALQQAFFKGDPAPAASGSGRATAPPTRTTGPAVTTPADDPTSAPVPRQRLSETVWLGSGGLDLDSRPAAKHDDGSDIRKDDFTEIAPGPGAHLTLWPGPGSPGYAQCHAHVERTSSVPLFDVPQNDWFCVYTSEGRTAAVRYLGIGDGGLFGFQITVWDL
jgi:hypothetical protein